MDLIQCLVNLIKIIIIVMSWIVCKCTDLMLVRNFGRSYNFDCLYLEFPRLVVCVATEIAMATVKLKIIIL